MTFKDRKDFDDYALTLIILSLKLLGDKLNIKAMILEHKPYTGPDDERGMGLFVTIRWPRQDDYVCVWSKELKSKKAYYSSTLNVLDAIDSKTSATVERKLSKLMDLPEKEFFIACTTAWLYNLAKFGGYLA